MGRWRVFSYAAIVAAVVLVLGAAPALADTGCTSSGVSTVTVTCAVGQDTWTVPGGVAEATFDVVGAAGGGAATNGGTTPGGNGGQLQATLSVSAGTSYRIWAGARGADGVSDAGNNVCSAGNGGAPGGASGGEFCGGQMLGDFAGGGGGGASIVSLGDVSNPANWLLVAGGGGGTSNAETGGNGGGATGEDGGGCSGTGGNQTGSTGSGQHLDGSSPQTNEQDGGGGGGYWGGAGTGTCGGGGGSGFITPSALSGSGFGAATNTFDGSVTITYSLIPGCSSSSSGQTVTVTCTAGQSTWTVPSGVYRASFDVEGAAGGMGNGVGSNEAGGDGGHLQAALDTTPGTNYTVWAGALGGAGDEPDCIEGAGGSPGGANGTQVCAAGQGIGNFAGGGGGGASIVSQGNPSVPGQWLLVAGGGGGGGTNGSTDGGAGGGTSGGDGGRCPGSGGNQTGSTGSGQQPDGSAAQTPADNGGGGGGGGGYWGGAGAPSGATSYCGGGGGSGFITSGALPGSGFLAPTNAANGTVTITYTNPAAPTESVVVPGDGATYAPGQALSTSFTCAEGSAGPGLTSCVDGQGRASGAALDTTSHGSHRFTVTATSRDGQTSATTVTYLVADPPSVTITTPVAGATFRQGASVLENFACAEGAGGVGILQCTDGSGRSSGSLLDTASAGKHTLTVTAVSGDGLRSTKTMRYNVAPLGERVQKSFGGLTFVLAGPRCVPPGSALAVALTKSGTSRTYRLVHYSLYVDKGRAHRVHRVIHGKPRTVIVFSPNLVTTASGRHSLSLGALGTGAHKVSVVILLRKRTHGSHSLTLRLPFGLC